MIISPDSHLINDKNKYEWSPERVKEAWATAYQELTEALSTGCYTKVVLMGGIPASGKTTWLKTNTKVGVIYFDATFTNIFGRGKVIEHIRKTSALPIEIVFLNTPKKTCLERNAARTEDRQVPEAAIERMYSAVRSEGFPSTEEGFSQVTIKM